MSKLSEFIFFLVNADIEKGMEEQDSGDKGGFSGGDNEVEDRDDESDEESRVEDIEVAEEVFNL